MNVLKKYAGFIKLEHTLFSLPLLFAGAVLAAGTWPSFRTTVLILFAGASARVVAMGLNRIIDRDIDRRNPRTRDRHLASGVMKRVEAWGLVLASLAVYLFSAWLLSDWCFRLSWIPLVAFAAYPYFKRVTRWAHVGLGLVWSLAPIGGYFAVRPSMSGAEPAFVLGAFCLFWLAGFDIIYATMDAGFDREAGLHSLPAAWGPERALKAAAVFHACAFITLAVLYGVWLSGPITVLLLLIIGACLILEQRFSQNVDFAFFQVNAVIGFIVFFFVYSGLKGF